MSDKTILTTAPLRAVTSREQLTNDPEIDLNRTAIDLPLLLSDFDIAKLGFASRAALPTKFDTLDEAVAKAIVTAARMRLLSLLNGELSPGAKEKPTLALPPRVSVETKPSASVVANFGGQITLLKPNQWFDGPPILFEAAGKAARCQYTVRLNAGVSTNLMVQIRKLGTIASCAVLNDLSATIENFNDFEIEGYWQLSFLYFGAKSAGPLKIDLHQLQFGLQ